MPTTATPLKYSRTGGCKRAMPTVEDFEVGVEIEGAFRRDACPQRGSHRYGVDMPSSYPKYDPQGSNQPWVLMSDSSIRYRGRAGAEVVSPKMKGEKALQGIIDMVTYLKENDFKVNASCGLHVHVGLNSICGPNASADDVVAFIAELNKLVWNTQTALFASTGTRRDNSGWCAPLRKGSNMMDLITNIRDKRKGTKDESDFRNISRRAYKYEILNLSRLSHGISGNKTTLEFRFMAGTLNLSKIMFHLTSIFFLCRLAWQNRHTQYKPMDWNEKSWTGSQPRGEGAKCLNFLIKRMNSKNSGYWMKGDSPILNEYWEKGQRWAKKMAEKFDTRY